MTTAENGREAEVSIYDAIGGYDINAKQFVSDLNEIQAETIHLRINSPGGSVIDGTAIFNALKRHSAKVITHVDGLAASMASVIAMAGDEVHMADNALMMIHNPWTISMGDADELRADADLLDKMQASILSAYGRSQYEPEEIKDLMDAETWFTAQEAFDAGLVDHIEGGLRAAAADFAALAASSELTIPAEKQVASLNKQIEAITKASAELSAELEEKAEQIESLAGELVQAKLDNEQAVLEKEAAEEITEAAKADLEKAVAELEAKDEEILAKDAEVDEAKDITDAAVANKAAEILQVSTAEPVADLGDEEPRTLSADEFWQEYHAITDLNQRNVWYAENKHRKI
ncbi:MAG: head maturation protease, ClpP-related [Akkermansiaceae bacterium]